MQDPNGVMKRLSENIQACLRIFRQLQHQRLERDISIYRKGFIMFLSYGSHRTGQVSVLSVQSVVEKKSRGKPFILLLSNSPAETDFPVKPRILDCSTKKNREKFAE